MLILITVAVPALIKRHLMYTTSNDDKKMRIREINEENEKRKKNKKTNTKHPTNDK